MNKTLFVQQRHNIVHNCSGECQGVSNRRQLCMRLDGPMMQVKTEGGDKKFLLFPPFSSICVASLDIFKKNPIPLFPPFSFFFSVHLASLHTLKDCCYAGVLPGVTLSIKAMRIMGQAEWRSVCPTSCLCNARSWV